MFCQYTYFTCFNDITNFKDAGKSVDWLKWRRAIAEEFMNKNYMWDVVKKPQNNKTVSN